LILICKNNNSHIYDSDDFETHCEKCRNRMMKPVKTKAFADVKPQLICEWDDEKNLPQTPFNTTYGSAQKVWWVCSVDRAHTWQAKPKHRSQDIHTGCPRCRGRFKPVGPRAPKTDVVKAKPTSDLFDEVEVEIDVEEVPQTLSLRDKFDNFLASIIMFIINL
jgi:predicted nucleic acid-binding Zn ribbon protein